MISRVNEPRQLYGLGSFVKKITKPIKKVVKSPLGKAALLGAGLYGLGGMKSLGGSGIFSGGQGLSRFGNIAKLFGSKGKFGNLLYCGKGADRKFSLGKAGLLGLGTAGLTLPFMADEEEEIIETPWEETPSSIANIRDMARNQDPSLFFMPQSQYVQSGFYAADGGRAGLVNGGEAGQAQAENMLKMQYQKYRNQGGTMSYQQFKMAVIKQAQQRGPMAQPQAQPQMMNKGGRSGYRFGEVVEDQESMFMTPQGDEVVTDQMEEIEGQTAGPAWFTQLVEHFMYLGYDYDEASDMAWDVGHGKMELGDVPEKKAKGGRVGLLGGGPVPGSHVAGYTTPAAYNKFDYPSGGVRVAAADGGRIGYEGGGIMMASAPSLEDSRNEMAWNLFGKPLHELTEDELMIMDEYNQSLMAQGGRVAAADGGIMPLLDLGGKEKDYRQDGGFVGIGRKEKADDVPARLSKNEFVFTADAVRNAGGGDVDAGAEVMENMMNHLEAGGQISEESQGIGAQGMYDNMKQLETRVA